MENLDLRTWDSPTIYMDTREKIDKKRHILDWMEQAGIRVIRHKLLVGDWMDANNPAVSVDTKTCGLQEVYSNVVQDHDRFRRECQRAVENHIRLVVLVEQDEIHSLEDVPNWVNPREREYRLAQFGIIKGGRTPPKAPPLSSRRLYNIMRTMTENYAVEWDFTTHKEAGQRICGILGLSPGSSSSLSPP